MNILENDIRRNQKKKKKKVHNTRFEPWETSILNFKKPNVNFVWNKTWEIQKMDAKTRPEPTDHKLEQETWDF